MRRVVVVAAACIAVVAAFPLAAPAAPPCDAPLAGCLAKCGNPITINADRPHPTAAQNACYADCRAAYNTCQASNHFGHHRRG